MATLNQLLRKRRQVSKRKSVVPMLCGSPQRRGIVVKLVTMKPKKPNSAIRKVAKVMLRKGYRKLTMYVPGIGHNLQEYSWVLVRGGRANDLPGVRYTGVKGKLDFSEDESFIRKNKRSKYGLKNPYK